MSERQAKATSRNIRVRGMMMTSVGRARERGETQGFMHVLVDGDTERIVGATRLGIEADEAIHAILDVMYAKVSYKTIQRAMHIHPTVSELIPTLLADLKPLEG